LLIPFAAWHCCISFAAWRCVSSSPHGSVTSTTIHLVELHSFVALRWALWPGEPLEGHHLFSTARPGQPGACLCSFSCLSRCIFARVRATACGASWVPFSRLQQRRQRQQEDGSGRSPWHACGQAASSCAGSRPRASRGTSRQVP
jgi:hypothetical protein